MFIVALIQKLPRYILLLQKILHSNKTQYITMKKTNWLQILKVENIRGKLKIIFFEMAMLL